VLEQHERLGARLAQVGAVVAVLSGKGGVGKSFVTAGLASALAASGRSVGVVDADLNGPSMSRMLGCEGARLGDAPDGVVPALGALGVRVMAMDLLQDTPDAPLRWKEPEGGHGALWQSSAETAALREFLGDVAWGELDLLLVDVPPGTDKIGRLLGLVPGLDAAVVVTTPGEVARSVVARSLRMVTEAGVPAVGLVSNMSGFRCPGCDALHPLFPGDAPARLAKRFRVPIWGEFPLDPEAGPPWTGARWIACSRPDACQACTSGPWPGPSRRASARRGRQRRAGRRPSARPQSEERHEVPLRGVRRGHDLRRTTAPGRRDHGDPLRLPGLRP
jgi:ATP-binding protein involved in chromosome partitioning